MALDPSYPEIDMRVFHLADWTDFYGDVKEAIPDNTPEPRGKPVILDLSWTLTMQITRSYVAPAWDSVSSSIWHASLGVQRDR